MTRRVGICPDAVSFRAFVRFRVREFSFFSLELPLYSTGEKLREKLLYAIQHGTDIDTDQNARDNVDWEAD
jgi:hypothetical protein